MAIYYLDSSALLKRYVNEVGTPWIQSLFDPALANRLAVAMICGAEIVAAVSRRLKGGGIPAVEGARMIQQFRSDFQSELELVEITLPVIQVAMDFAERHGLRGYDAVQLAAASALRDASTARGIGDVVFVSSDLELNAAAMSNGLLVENPLSHP